MSESMAHGRIIVGEASESEEEELDGVNISEALKEMSKNKFHQEQRKDNSLQKDIKNISDFSRLKETSILHKKLFVITCDINIVNRAAESGVKTTYSDSSNLKVSTPIAGESNSNLESSFRNFLEVPLDKAAHKIELLNQSSSLTKHRLSFTRVALTSAAQNMDAISCVLKEAREQSLSLSDILL